MSAILKTLCCCFYNPCDQAPAATQKPLLNPPSHSMGDQPNTRGSRGTSQRSTAAKTHVVYPYHIGRGVGIGRSINPAIL